MFRRLLAWLRGWSFGTAVPESDGSERRVWVRSLSDVETSLKLADAPATGRMSGRIRNISRGGINLLLDRELESGALLSVELPGDGPGDEYFVLACVLRAQHQPSGEWSIGCTFARELEDDEVRSLTSRPIPPFESDERSFVRFPCPTKATYLAVSTPGRKPSDARVINISPKGILLSVSEFIDVGAVLNLELHGANGNGVVAVLASVTRVIPHPDGEWSLGCNFISRLADKDLEALL
ncbi:MAG: PilZ domain-containing protein [Gemmataceae bacterium]|nr:PilZ domain-containing protein [Gemmataceae bacterium]